MSTHTHTHKNVILNISNATTECITRQWGSEYNCWYTCLIDENIVFTSDIRFETHISYSDGCWWGGKKNPQISFCLLCNCTLRPKGSTHTFNKCWLCRNMSANTNPECLNQISSPSDLKTRQPLKTEKMNPFLAMFTLTQIHLKIWNPFTYHLGFMLHQLAH